MSTPEDQWFERKSARVTADVFAKSIIGMANAEGGLVVVGLSDGVVEELSAHARHINELRRVAQTHCAPPPRVRFAELPVDDGKVVLLADVSPGRTVHESTSGHCYLRVGDSTMKLSAAQREELLYDRGAAEYEARPTPGITVGSLDAGLVDGLRQAIGAQGNDERVLAARSLLDLHGEVTIAAFLLLAPRPQELMPYAHVRVLRYLSAHAGTGGRQSLADDGDRRIEGPIPHVIEQAAALVEEWMPRRRALREDGKFGPVDVVPRDAWLEGLVNAVVHRSYSMAGDHIRVHLYPDRVEIESPGRFPGIVDPERPLEIARYARNPRIARVCNDLGITQEKGEGIVRIFDEMRMRGLADPIYRQTSGSVRLTLLSTPRLDAETEARLPGGAHGVLEVLRAAGRPLGTGEIAAGIGRRRPATIRALKALQEVGEVVWEGKSAKDPRATWRLPTGD
ncbi:ATP-binding protein [Luteococcus japonicus]|uniref:ATP-binding protein n=1 Tax=Luteococcus japonicus TaxID=33984 RepID=UPI00211932CC|nr:ATP-binding protein [Luteococcus japonicus]